MRPERSIVQIRPGVVLGDYPQRQPDDPGALDRLAERVVRRLRPLQRNLRPERLERFVQRVNELETTLGNAASLAAAAVPLRRKLRRAGLTEELIAQSFALVRAASIQQLGMRHYDCQLMAGRVLIAGALAEMNTGEGKTLAATLPACTAALAGIPVHIVTANDYLVSRDAAAMAPVYRALGLSVGAITESSPSEMRREAYARDITYVSSKQLAFDYLRDCLNRRRRDGVIHLQLRRLFRDAPGDRTLLMRGLCFAIVDEADSVLIDEARTPFVIARERDTGDTARRCRAALLLAASMQRCDYDIDLRDRQVQLSASGLQRVLRDTSIDGSRRLREAVVQQALAALHLYRRDRDYLVLDGEVRIIDPHSGRIMSDRSWERGLHQMIECKEACELTAPRETLARLTYQRLFRRYLRLAGMTGTAREVSDEIATTYRMPFVSVPTHNPDRRLCMDDRLCRNRRQKWAAIVEMVRAEHASGRPVLVGTRTVADSEALSERLTQAGLEHALLNARQDADEARIVARAGFRGAITVATNMAGRGTDIELGPGVAALGGLHVIVAERNDARRIDRQLTGRCARQGDPGSFIAFVAPDDDLLLRYGPPLLLGLLRHLRPEHRLYAVMLKAALRTAQKRCERDHRNARRNLAIMQDQLDGLLAVSGPQE